MHTIGQGQEMLSNNDDDDNDEEHDDEDDDGDDGDDGDCDDDDDDDTLTGFKCTQVVRVHTSGQGQEMLINDHY